MYIRTPEGPIAGPGSLALARSPAAAKKRVRTFRCKPEELKTIGEELGKSVKASELRAAVETAAGDAVAWARRAADALMESPRSSRTSRIFSQVFGRCPEYLPSRYARRRRKWKDWGELVAIRLRAAAKILDGGWVRYYCWNGRRHCYSTCRPPKEHYACHRRRGYRICLGLFFWRAWDDGDEATMASTLLHEALHIYFGFMGHSGRIANIMCYETFTLRINRKEVDSDTTAFCARLRASSCSRPRSKPTRFVRRRSMDGLARGLEVTSSGSVTGRTNRQYVHLLDALHRDADVVEGHVDGALRPGG